MATFTGSISHNNALPDINWGIIGCGNVCEVKSGPAFYKAKGSNLMAVMRRTPSLAEDFAQRHGVPKWYSDADELLADPDIDAVYIATPPGSHLEYALKVCEAKKACYVEKPMARCKEECDAMITAFKDAGLPLFVGYYRRYLPKFLEVKDIINSGSLGEITDISIRLCQERLGKDEQLGWRLSAETAGGGLFLDLASHTLDLIASIFGPLQDVQGIASRVGEGKGTEDNVRMFFKTQEGILGSGIWNFACSLSEDQIIIDGTQGRLKFGCFNNDPITLQYIGESSPRSVEASIVDHVHQPLVEEMMKDLQQWKLTGEFKEEETFCSSTGTEAMKTTGVMDTVLNEYYSGRECEFWCRFTS